MRYNKKIYLQTITDGAYNAETNCYDADTVTEELRRAGVVDTSEETMRLVFGEIRPNSKTIQLRRIIPKTVTRIRYEGTIYSIEQRLEGLRTYVYVLAEVQ